MEVMNLSRALASRSHIDKTGLDRLQQLKPGRGPLTIAFRLALLAALLTISAACQTMPAWTSTRHHRILVQVDPIELGRSYDERPAELQLNFEQLLASNKDSSDRP